ncbi:MAG: hypothetical protein MUE30_15890 [Spirosomaceae bacterium]|jgi:hypothetical protein|nr:hypothetical protein [Spirosomataceae bacterium]
MTTVTPPKTNSKKTTKGKFKNEAEFLAAEKERFDKVFGSVDWTTIK